MMVRLLGGLVVLAALIAASAGFAATIKIEIKNLKFSPAEVTVNIGDTIEWTNGDFVNHTATARDNSWDVALAAHGGTGRVTITTAGDIEYFCRFHPNMKGHIKVGP